MRSYFPFLDWIKGYGRTELSGDLSAGLTVGVMLIPQGMAYSMLAGLPPIYGLYASTIPLILYALFGTSRQLAVGPVAMVALLISSGVGALAELGSAEFIALAILLAFMVGAIQFLMGAFRLGFLVNFLSHPVIAGFTSAAAIIIGFSQLKHLLGIDIPRGKVHETVVNVAQNIEAINLPTLIVGLSSVIILILVKKKLRRIPGPLVVVGLGILFVYFMGLYEQGVSIVKDVPGGFPPFSIPQFGWDSVTALIPTALTISFVGFMESIAVAKAIQAKHKNYKIDANQELIGLGLANVVGAFFKAFPVTGGFSRTAVNDQAGAKTGMASIFSAVLIVLTLLFLTEYFYYLPKAVLAAIIMVAVFGLIDYDEAIHLWKTDRIDFWLFMVTAIGTLSLGIEQGILIGVALSLGVLIYRASYPHIAQLARIHGTDIYRNINRFDDLEVDERYIILRIDAPLFFGNSTHIREKIEKLISQRPNCRAVILHGQSISTVDSSAVHMLKDVVDQYRGRIDFYFAELIGPVRDIMAKSGLFEAVGKDHFFVNIQEAVDCINQEKEETELKAYTFQTNED